MSASCAHTCMNGLRLSRIVLRADICILLMPLLNPFFSFACFCFICSAMMHCQHWPCQLGSNVWLKQATRNDTDNTCCPTKGCEPCLAAQNGHMSRGAEGDGHNA